MMGLVRGWLLGVACTAMILTIADSLAPEGNAKKVCRMAGGLALLLAAAGPLLRLDGGALVQALEAFSYDENGVPCPWEVTARGVWTDAAQEALGRLLEDDLGVPPQRQHYEESVP